MTRDDKLLRAERAVIEAARVLAPKLRNLPPNLLIPALKFCLAVEALAELEVETPVPLDKVKTWEGES